MLLFSDPVRKYRQRAPITAYNNIVCRETTRVASICDELFVLVDRRPRGVLSINVYDTSEKPAQCRVVNDDPSDADTIGPEVFTPMIQAMGYITEDSLNDLKNSWSVPSKNIGMSGTRSQSLSDLSGAAAKEVASEMVVEPVDWFDNLQTRHDVADLVRTLTLDAATVEKSMKIEIMKVILRVTLFVVYKRDCYMRLCVRNYPITILTVTPAHV